MPGICAIAYSSWDPGHTVMDIGLFAYWWTGIAGDFTARPSSETGVDAPFLIASAAFVAALSLALLAIARLRSLP